MKLPQPTVAENSLDDIRLSTFDETDDLHRAATFGTTYSSNKSFVFAGKEITTSGARRFSGLQGR